LARGTVLQHTQKQCTARKITKRTGEAGRERDWGDVAWPSASGRRRRPNQSAMSTGFEPAHGGKKAPQAQNFAVIHTTSTFFLARTACTQLALCAGTIKRQFAIFPGLTFYFPSCFGFETSRGKSKNAHRDKFSQFLSKNKFKLAQAPFWLCALGQAPGRLGGIVLNSAHYAPQQSHPEITVRKAKWRLGQLKCIIHYSKGSPVKNSMCLLRFAS
jgi:hypothetical protein